METTDTRQDRRGRCGARLRLRRRGRADGTRHRGRSGARRWRGRLRSASTTSTRRPPTATASQRRTSAVCSRRSEPTWSSAPSSASPTTQRGRAAQAVDRLARGEPRPARPRPRRSAAAPQPDLGRRRVIGTIDADRRARPGGARRSQDLRRQGKIRFFGITALGDTPALHRVHRRARARHGAGLLQPAQSERRRAAAAGLSGPGLRASSSGTRARRRWAPSASASSPAGALSGVEARHPLGIPSVEPIASGPDYARRRRARAPVRSAGAGGTREAASWRRAFASRSRTRA